MLSSPRDVHLRSVQATDEPASIGPVDVVLFCVKLWDVESAGAAIRPLVGSNTAVIPLQNGIDASERLIPILGKDAVMGGVAQISASVAEPGVIEQTGTFMRLVFGELDGRPSPRGAAFHSLCQKAGFDSVNSDEILVALWEQFVLLATNSSVVALTRLPFGKLRDDPEVFALFEKGVAEVAAVGRARGVDLPSDIEARALRATRNFPPRDDALNGCRFVTWQEVGTALARRQGGGTGPRARRPDAHVRGDVRGAEALRQRCAGLRRPRERPRSR